MKREISLNSSNKEIDAALQKKKDAIPKLKDEIKRMIPVRGLSIIDRKLKDFIGPESPRKKIPQTIRNANKPSFRATSIQ